jgi:hypothetical protein
MAIDRIGKGGGLPQAPETGGVQPKGAVERPFQVERGQVDRAASATAPRELEATSPLARLRAGEIDVHGYVDLKVDEATSSLTGLSPAELDAIKKTLRDQMATDPGLADLVRTATGRVPKAPED